MTTYQDWLEDVIDLKILMEFVCITGFTEPHIAVGLDWSLQVK